MATVSVRSNHISMTLHLCKNGHPFTKNTSGFERHLNRLAIFRTLFSGPVSEFPFGLFNVSCKSPQGKTLGLKISMQAIRPGLKSLSHFRSLICIILQKSSASVMVPVQMPLCVNSTKILPLKTASGNRRPARAVCDLGC